MRAIGVATGCMLVMLFATATAKSHRESSNAPSTGGGQADLVVTMSLSPDPVSPGGLVTYRVRVANLGPDSAAQARIYSGGGIFGLQIPTIQGPPGWACYFLGLPPPSLFCGIDQFPVGVAEFLITARAPSTPHGTFLRSTIVESDTPDPNPANNRVDLFGTIATSVPALSRLHLALLALLLAAIGARTAAHRG